MGISSDEPVITPVPSVPGCSSCPGTVGPVTGPSGVFQRGVRGGTETVTSTDNGEFEGFGADGGADGWDLADVLWAPGVDYVGLWRAAKREADALNSVFRAAGLSPADARAVAVSGADGVASVRIRTSAPGARRLAGLLRRVS